MDIRGVSQALIRLPSLTNVLVWNRAAIPLQPDFLE